MAISAGQLTYDAEGTEGGPFHSRTLSVPSDCSGLTIGRGYDMKEKTSAQIDADLTRAGLTDDEAKQLSPAAGLSGDGAKQFITDNSLEAFEISMDVQEALFDHSYGAVTADVLRICSKPDCIAAYGAVDWDNLSPYIKDVLVDLRYRGDYNPSSRKRIQTLVAKNDVQSFTEDLSTPDNWTNVPKDRFNRRVAFLNA